MLSSRTGGKVPQVRDLASYLHSSTPRSLPVVYPLSGGASSHLHFLKDSLEFTRNCQGSSCFGFHLQCSAYGVFRTALPKERRSSLPPS